MTRQSGKDGGGRSPTIFCLSDWLINQMFLCYRWLLPQNFAANQFISFTFASTTKSLFRSTLSARWESVIHSLLSPSVYPSIRPSISSFISVSTCAHLLHQIISSASQTVSRLSKDQSVVTDESLRPPYSLSFSLTHTFSLSLSLSLCLSIYLSLSVLASHAKLRLTCPPRASLFGDAAASQRKIIKNVSG